MNAGSTENLILGLSAGSYYVAVVDYAGVAMRYSMCIKQIPATLGSRTCNLILPGPAVPAASKARPQASPGVFGSRRSTFLAPRARP